MHELYSIYSFIFGLLVGSFLNVVILRLPAKKNITSDRSACPVCGGQLRWFHNVPVISFIFLRGRCGFCKTAISWRYPLIELLTGLISFWLFPQSLTTESFGFYLFYFSIACVLICHFIIDLEHQLLLDTLNIYLLVLILPFALLTSPWQHWAIGGLLGFGSPLLVTWIFYKLRGQVGLGGGDIKLFGILGILLGPTGVMFTIFLSCSVGAIIGLSLIAIKKMTKEKPIPFGPSIILVASVQIFFPSVARTIQAWLL